MSVRRNHAEHGRSVVHVIDVTSFIDVIVALLIIFIMTAPRATVDVAVDLPTSNAEGPLRPEQPDFPRVKPDLTLALGDAAVSRREVHSAYASKRDRTERGFLRTDKSVAYDESIDTMNALRGAGYLKVALVGIEADK
jgi:biopolymer transport protein ExbD